VPKAIFFVWMDWTWTIESQNNGVQIFPPLHPLWVGCATSPFMKHDLFITSYKMYTILQTRYCFIGFYDAELIYDIFRLIRRALH